MLPAQIAMLLILILLTVIDSFLQTGRIYYVRRQFCSIDIAQMLWWFDAAATISMIIKLLVPTTPQKKVICGYKFRLAGGIIY